MKLLSKLQIGLIVLFTFIETEVLTFWFWLLMVLLFPDKAALVYLSALGIAAQIALFIGLLLEHTPAVIAGDFPQKGAVVPQDD